MLILFAKLTVLLILFHSFIIISSSPSPPSQCHNNNKTSTINNPFLPEIVTAFQIPPFLLPSSPALLLQEARRLRHYKNRYFTKSERRARHDYAVQNNLPPPTPPKTLDEWAAIIFAEAGMTYYLPFNDDTRSTTGRIGSTDEYSYSLVERYILNSLRPRLDPENLATGAEYWVHIKTDEEPSVVFHYDKDESIHERLEVPLFSAILYLTNDGGPTVVLNQRPLRFDKSTRSAPTMESYYNHVPTSPDTVWVSFPSVGKLLVLKGEMHHGVLPCEEAGKERVTLVVNFWSRDLRPPFSVVLGEYDWGRMGIVRNGEKDGDATTEVKRDVRGDIVHDDRPREECSSLDFEAVSLETNRDWHNTVTLHRHVFILNPSRLLFARIPSSPSASCSFYEIDQQTLGDDVGGGVELWDDENDDQQQIISSLTQPLCIIFVPRLHEITESGRIALNETDRTKRVDSWIPGFVRREQQLDDAKWGVYLAGPTLAANAFQRFAVSVESDEVRVLLYDPLKGNDSGGGVLFMEEKGDDVTAISLKRFWDDYRLSR